MSSFSLGRHPSHQPESPPVREPGAEAPGGRMVQASPPGVKKASGKHGPANVEDTAGHGATDSEDDDNTDLFGSDEEEESEEAKRLREECLTQDESKTDKNPPLLPSLPSSWT